MMGEPLGSSHVSSQKQNRATVVERARDVVDPGPGCDTYNMCSFKYSTSLLEFI